jgi:hypothetical protein
MRLLVHYQGCCVNASFHQVAEQLIICSWLLCMDIQEETGRELLAARTILPVWCPVDALHSCMAMLLRPQ